MTSRIGAVAADAGSRWSRIKQRNPWLVHVLRAYKRLNDHNGSYYAAGITFFSFLALFPLVLLAVSVLGFVLHSHPALMASLLDKVEKQAPGSFGDTLKSFISSAVSARTGLGVIGLLGVALTGAGWIANLRAALRGIWGQPSLSRNFVVAKIADLAVLVGLGLAIVVSLGLTTVGTAVSGKLVAAANLSSVPGMHALLTVIGLLIAVLGDVLVFGWVLVRLPKVDIPRIIAVRGSIMAAIGFEVLKVVGTYTIARSSHSVTAGPFAGILAILIWIQLVSRFMLFCAAWMATAEVISAEQASTARVSLAKQPPPVDDRPAGALKPLGVAGTLVGAGAAAGGAAALWARHRLTGDDAGPAAQRRRRNRPAVTANNPASKAPTTM